MVDSSIERDVKNPVDNRRAISLMMLMFALSVRFFHLICLQRAPFFNFKIGDAARYDQWAQQIAAGDWIGQGVFYQAPLYPYFLGVVYSIFGDDVMTVRKIQVTLGAIACVFLMNATWNLFGKRAGIVAGIVASLYAPSIFYESLIQKSVLDLFLLSAIIWLFSKLVIANRVDSLKTNKFANNFSIWIWIGISTGALCLTRENALVLIPMMLLWIGFGRSSQELLLIADLKTRAVNKLKMTIAFGIGIALLLAPVALRNYVVGGEFHLTTSQLGPNFYIGNNPRADGTYKPLRYGRGDAKYEATDAKELAEEALGRELSAGEVSDYWLGESIAFITSEPGGWLRQLGRKTMMSINRAEIIDTIDPLSHAEYSIVLKMTSTIFHFGFLAPLAIFGLYSTRRKLTETWLMHLMLAGFLATLVVFFVFGRYRLPLVPLMIPFCAVTISRFIEVCRSSRFVNFENWQKSFKPALIMALMVGVCCFPLIDEAKSQAITFNNFGGQMLMRGEFAKAERYFERSLEIDSSNAFVFNNLGVLYRETGDYDKAIECFEKAISKTECEHIIALRNLTNLRARLETSDQASSNLPLSKTAFDDQIDREK